jgi:hypothetical protein
MLTNLKSRNDDECKCNACKSSTVIKAYDLRNGAGVILLQN